MKKFLQLYSTQTLKLILIFVGTVISCLIIKFIQYPSLFIYPEIIQDTGINFLRLTIKDSIQSLRVLDAGYLPLFQRIISILVVNIIPPKYYNIFFIYIPLLLLSIFSSLIITNTFKLLSQSIFTRYLITLAIVSFPCISTNYLENFIIYGTIFLIYFFIRFNQEQLNFSNYQLMLLYFISLILIPSKPYLLVLIIIPLILIIKDIYFKNISKIKYELVLLIPFLLQFFIMLIT